MKVIIVDDEILVRAGMRMMIPWDKLGFDTVGEAADGEEGLRRAKEIRPDLMLVDITMPGMNGLELIRQVKSELPDCRFIILSCHSEVSYLKEAIRIGVTDYILKDSLNSEEMTEALLRIADGFKQREEVRREEHKSLRTEELFLRAGLDPQLRCREFAALTQENAPAGAGVSAHKYVSTQNAYFVFLLQVRQFSHLPVAEKISEQIVKEYEVFSVHYCAGNSVVFFAAVRRDFHPQQLIAHRCVETLSEHFSIEAAGAASECRYGDEPVKELLAQANAAAEMRWIRGFRTVAVYSSGQMEQNRIKLSRIRESHLPLQDIYELTKAQEYLDELNSYIRKVPFIRRSDVLHEYSELAFHLNQELKRADMGEHSFTPEEMPVGEPGRESYERLYDSFYEKLIYLRSQLREKGTHPVIVEIKRYIGEHLDEKIHLEDIAGAVHLTRTYISSLFKKETGMNINDYITEQKLQYARELLLGGTPISIIVEKSGIQSESYFAKLFRERYQMTPSQYVKEYKSKYIDKNK